MPSNSSNLPDGVEDLTAPDSLELETLRRSLIDFYQSKSFQLTYPSLIEFACSLFFSFHKIFMIFMWTCPRLRRTQPWQMMWFVIHTERR